MKLRFTEDCPEIVTTCFHLPFKKGAIADLPVVPMIEEGLLRDAVKEGIGHDWCLSFHYLGLYFQIKMPKDVIDLILACVAEHYSKEEKSDN